MKKIIILPILLMGMLTAVSCSSAEDLAPSPAPTSIPATLEPTASSEPQPTITPLSTVTESFVEAESTEAQAEPPTAEPEPTQTPLPMPTLHPAEQLIQSFSEPSQTNGELLILYGQVLDTAGNPIQNAVIEIWQTDNSGVYDHPDDPGTGTRDITFQFFGMASADSDGWYAFRTIVPGRYEPRPRHIHFKVKQNGSTLLTSQFYFSDDIEEVQGEGMFRAVGDSGDLLLLQLVQNEGGSILANGRIVIDTGSGSGDLPITPSQAQGPYYPVVSLAGFDNDLAVIP